MQASAAGDVKGDGLDDLLIAEAGRSYLVFGRSRFEPGLEFSIPDGTDGFAYDGELSPAGNINGDGFDDLVFNIYDPKENLDLAYVVYACR